MAKMGEGEYYYYLPTQFSKDFYIAQRDSPHPNYTVIAARVSQDKASLIVDALNEYANKKTTYEVVAYDTGGYGDNRSKSFNNEKDAMEYARAQELKFSATVVKHVRPMMYPVSTKLWSVLDGQT